ncbi:MAG: radical SAM protein [Polyangiaceae bacterium]|jgi:SynChlorMet cassette radical SAM/SPASM protein ScmF|nr:radical SAM protein [Polyangiaceae bacterium]
MTAPSQVPPLRRIYLYLSGSCNLACRHCWIDPRFSKTAGADDLSLEAIQSIVIQAQELGLRSVKLTGGEPMLHPQLVPLIRFLHESKIGITMETNGTLIGEAEAKLLKAVGATLSISLDGPDAALHEDLRRVPGCFEQTLAGMRALQRENVSYQVIACLYRNNQQRVVEIPALIRTLGATSLKINPVTGMTRSATMGTRGELLSIAEILEVHQQLQRAAEAAGIRLAFDVPPAFLSIAQIRRDHFGTCGILNILGVLHNGHASLCGIGEVKKELDFGDLTKTSVREVWDTNPTLQAIREHVPARLGGICARCVLKRYCLGKCIAHEYDRAGNLFGGHWFCQSAFEEHLFPLTRLVEQPRHPGD